MLTYILKKRASVPLYEQLYRCIRDDIISGKIEGGEKLPSKRELAAHLGISKVTVENAYADLISEGYVYSLEKRGYYAEKSLTVPAREKKISGADKSPETRFETDLSSNTVPTAQFPFSVWSKLMREMILNYSTELLEPMPYNGVQVLREAICRYLYEERGMDINPDDIVIGAGSEYLYTLIIRLLGSDKVYGIENPSYHKIRKVYEMNGAAVRSVPFINGEPDRDFLFSGGIDVLHISPSHNFPTGNVMGAKCRHEIISHANSLEGKYIIEDDFDSELRFTGRPLPPVQTLDTQGKVIYINTFSKTISPSFRISYMILPDKLSEKYRNEFRFNSCTVPSFEQYTLAAFINRGYFERHINRMKKYYRELHSGLIDEFEKSRISGVSVLSDPAAGLHFSLKLDTALSDDRIRSEMEKNGVRVSFMSDYLEGENTAPHILLVNYSGLDREKFGKALEILYTIISQSN